MIKTFVLNTLLIFLKYFNWGLEFSWMLDAAFHEALRFITGCKTLTHHCALHSWVNSLLSTLLLH